MIVLIVALFDVILLSLVAIIEGVIPVSWFFRCISGAIKIFQPETKVRFHVGCTTACLIVTCC